MQIGTHSFTFDHVYGNGGTPSSSMFEECVAPLVDGLFQGYNATVLAYGQVIFFLVMDQLKNILLSIYVITDVKQLAVEQVEELA